MSPRRCMSGASGASGPSGRKKAVGLKQHMKTYVQQKKHALKQQPQGLNMTRAGAVRAVTPPSSSSSAAAAAAATQGSTHLSSSVIIRDAFVPAKQAQALRQHFLDTFEPKPASLSAERFVWDYWHVPDQYTLLRTPADNFFRTSGWDEIEAALIQFAERELGCSAMTPVWLSCYVDGCVQHLHADVPHGPWAFVYSLTEWDENTRPEFTGGETQMLRAETLDYWRGWFDGGAAKMSETGLNQDGIVEMIQPHFNRLTVFDPRVPHGVREVRGTRDVRKGRLVLHGWFSAPTPFYEGALATADGGLEDSVAEIINVALEPLFSMLSDPDMYAPIVGICSVRMRIGAEGGTPTEVRVLASNLKAHPGSDDVVEEQQAVEKAIVDALSSSGPFPSSEGHTDITLPLVFE